MSRVPCSQTRIGLPLIALLVSLACGAETDRRSYVAGTVGTTTLHNDLPQTLWLGGCNRFVQERRKGEEWIPEGGDVVCIFEGLAEPVPGRSSITSDFTARDPGTWRLAYAVGRGCTADEPLRPESCDRILTVRTRPFQVVPADDEEALCHGTGGTWDPFACGHRVCGSPVECTAIVPGCDCGPTGNFVPGEGCVAEPACLEKEALCTNTGGVWDPLSCGDYVCGVAPICAAVIPGCDCGPGAIFVEGTGCLAVPCGAPQ